MAGSIADAVIRGFEEQVLKCGQMTGKGMKDMIVECHSKMETLIDLKLAELKNSFPTTIKLMK
jgi:hypothetical protein